VFCLSAFHIPAASQHKTAYITGGFLLPHYQVQLWSRNKSTTERKDKNCRRVVLEVTEATTKKYAVFTEKIIVGKSAATCFGLSWEITKEINYTK
jgi:hypothetical protein